MNTNKQFLGRKKLKEDRAENTHQKNACCLHKEHFEAKETPFCPSFRKVYIIRVKCTSI